MDVREEVRQPLDKPFFEEIYLDAFDDVAKAVAQKVHSSARHHFMSCGLQEGRLHNKFYTQAFNEAERKAVELDFSLELCKFTTSKHFTIAGWAADSKYRLSEVEIITEFGELLERFEVSRYRRQDVAQAKGIPAEYPYGFFAAGKVSGALPEVVWVRLILDDGKYGKLRKIETGAISLRSYREVLLFYLSAIRDLEGGELEAVKALKRGAGDSVVGVNKLIAEHASDNVITQVFGLRNEVPKLSFVVCLFGKIEYLFIQQTLFSKDPSCLKDFEFVYVLNSPEQSERLVNEARLAALIYDVCIRVVIMPENVGFGAATNRGAKAAQADQIIVLNPDVFPVFDDWWRRYDSVVSRLPEDQTAFFGVPLLYDDGSVMHSGMSFCVDEKISFDPITAAPSITSLMRVEHDGKGMSSAERHRYSREVTAITGAFISVKRKVFEELGGFDEGFVFGHYEDADLCARARRAGYHMWIHPIPFWHLEGKGSRRLPILETTSLVNRWLFTDRWLDLVRV